MKIRWLSLTFALFFLALPACAAEQRAFALKDPLTLYSKPDENSKSWEVSLPEAGVSVPSAIRKEGALWYKVKVDGKEGWLFNEGIRLKMGPKSKAASNIFKRISAAQAKIVKGGAKGWERVEDMDNGTVQTWSSKDALFQLREGKLFYFKARTAAACKAFLGFEAIDTDKDALKGKVGTPTVRETPVGERSISILSYELEDRDMTLSFNLNSDVVFLAELYAGKTGQAEENIPDEVLNLRHLE